MLFGTNYSGTIHLKSTARIPAIAGES